MISSFYGGRKGTDLAVVQIFNNLQELAEDLKNPTNSQVEFEDYVLISYGPPIPSQKNPKIMENPNWIADIDTIKLYPDLKVKVYLNYFNGTLWQKVLGDSLADGDSYISWPLDNSGGAAGNIVYKLVSSLVVLPDLQINLGENQENTYVPSIYKTPAEENNGILDLGYSLELPDLYKGQGKDSVPEGAKQGDYYLDLNTGLFYQFGEKRRLKKLVDCSLNL